MDNTPISSKYKTIGMLKEQNRKSILLVIAKMKNGPERDHMIKWVVEKFYINKMDNSSVAKRVRLINSTVCVEYVSNYIFKNLNKTPKRIIIDRYPIIMKMHKYSGKFNGTFMDYLLRRVINEIRKTQFNDHRANFMIMQDPSRKQYYDSVRSDAKTVDILGDIFITSLYHTLFFAEEVPPDIEELFLKEVESEEFKEYVLELIPFIESLIGGEEVMLNPAVGIAALTGDADLIIGDTLYDLKCSIRCKDNLDLLQLLAYTSLLKHRGTDIKAMRILNPIRGEILEYDVRSVKDEEWDQYLAFLTNKM